MHSNRRRQKLKAIVIPQLMTPVCSADSAVNDYLSSPLVSRPLRWDLSKLNFIPEFCQMIIYLYEGGNLEY